MFGRRAPLELDVGFGGGRLLMERARQAPEVDLVGLDVRRGLVEQGCQRIERAGLTNIHLLAANANLAVEALFHAGELRQVYVMFPDPWFKKRHHKRRVVTPELVRILQPRMAPGGRLHIATDQKALAHEMLEVVDAHPGFLNTAGVGCFAPGNTSGVVTETESYYQRSGKRVWYLAYEAQSAVTLNG